MKLIVGLGNPGDKYAETRHNVGFRFIVEMAKKYNINSTSYECEALVGKGKMGDQNIILAQPTTFMNKSGKAVKFLANAYNIDEEDIIIIYDDMDLPPGKIRIKKSGSSGGHNGIKSIINRLGTRNVPRIRIGIGHPPPKLDVVNYVLGNFSRQEDRLISEAIENGIDAVECIMEEGFQIAMSKFN